MSVRAVRDDTEGVVVVGEGVVAIAEAKFWLGLGCESCPWAVGDSVTAYIKDMTLLINGSGAVASTPWSDKADGIVKLQVGEGVTKLGGTMATLPNLTSVNGLSMSALGDLTVIPEDMVLVTKESIQAAKAMTVQIVNGQIELGVSVCSNADITVSTTNWTPVRFTEDTKIGLSADGTKLILPIPVAAQQGFMILQTGDAKVPEGERGPVIGKPWYTPTVED